MNYELRIFCHCGLDLQSLDEKTSINLLYVNKIFNGKITKIISIHNTFFLDSC